MKDTSRQRSIRCPASKHLRKVSRRTRTATRNHRDLHRGTHRCGQLAIKPIPHPIGVHAGEQNLPRPASLSLASPRDNIQPGRLAPTTHIHLSIFNTFGPTLGIDRNDHRLRPKTRTNLADQLRPCNRSRVDAHLIRPRVKDCCRIIRAPHTAAHGKWHKQRRRCALHRIDERPAPLVRRRNVEQHDLIRARGRMSMRQLRRIARIDDIDKLNPLNNSPASYVQTSNNPFRQHINLTRKKAPSFWRSQNLRSCLRHYNSTKFFKTRNPTSADFSG